MILDGYNYLLLVAHELLSILWLNYDLNVWLLTNSETVLKGIVCLWWVGWGGWEGGEFGCLMSFSHLLQDKGLYHGRVNPLLSLNNVDIWSGVRCLRLNFASIINIIIQFWFLSAESDQYIFKTLPEMTDNRLVGVSILLPPCTEIWFAI